MKTTDEINAMPYGTVGVEGQTKWLKTPEGWMVRNGSIYAAADVAQRSDRMVFQTYEYPPFVETLASVKQRFRTFCIGAGARAGVPGGARAVLGVMDGLGLSPADLTPGMFVDLDDRLLWQRIPVGSVVWQGTPAQSDTYFLGVVSEGQTLTRIFGTGGTPRWVRVASFPAGTTVSPDLSTVGDTDGVFEFKSEVWRLGFEAKGRWDWCSAFERIIDILGVTDPSQPPPARPTTVAAGSSHGLSVGDPLTLALMRSLPIGTIINQPGRNSSGWIKDGTDNWRPRSIGVGMRGRSSEFSIRPLRFASAPSNAEAHIWRARNLFMVTGSAMIAPDNDQRWSYVGRLGTPLTTADADNNIRVLFGDLPTGSMLLPTPERTTAETHIKESSGYWRGQTSGTRRLSRWFATNTRVIGRIGPDGFTWGQ